MCVRRKTFPEQGRRQRFDAGRERTPNPLGRGADIADDADQQATTLINGMIAREGANCLRIDLMFLRCNRNGRPLIAADLAVLTMSLGLSVAVVRLISISLACQPPRRGLKVSPMIEQRVRGKFPVACAGTRAIRPLEGMGICGEDGE